MTNKKEYKILRKTLSLTLAILVSILGLPLAKPQQVSATETSDPKYLSSMTITATAKTTWDKQYNTEFYKEIINNYNNYTADSPLKIDSADRLAAFARAVNVGKKDFSGKYVKLTKDINLGDGNEDNLTITKETDSADSSKFTISITGTASNVWVPIGNINTKFKGNFDGGNCKISNMTVLGNVSYSGLFGYVSDGSIKNTGVTGNVYVSSFGNCYAGGLVGYSSSISNSYATGNVYVSSSSSSSYGGGLVGYNDSGSITNSYATGDVYASSSSSSSAYAGGLAGRSSSSSISNSYATGNVYVFSSSTAYGGGLVGDSGSSISNSYATGNVSSSSSSFVFAGGLVGRIYSSITNSYATGNVYASSSSASAYAGGLVGDSGSSISNSYATGNVSTVSSSSVRAGGLVGYNDSGSMTNSYATGNVSASASTSTKVYAGGLVGLSSGSITNGYYYSGATIDGGTGATISKDGTGLNLEQMTGNRKGRAKDNMTGFSEDNWEFPGDNGLIKYLPRLKVITYNETTNPAPRLVGIISSDFDFKAPANSTYDGSAKEATVTSEILEIPDDKITVKYYNSSGTKLTSPPKNAGTYIVKIDVAAGDKYEAQTDITADYWTFTITKANPTIYSAATSVTYSPGLTLAKVPLPNTAGNTPGSWAWTNSSTAIPSAGTYGYIAKYTPTDTTNYNYFTKSIIITVHKADPTIYSTSTTAAYKPGLTLGSVLPPSISETATAGSWIWSKSTTPISSAGAHYFEAKFKPTDSKNYNEVTKFLLVTVSKATLQASDFKFAAPSNLEYSADYKTATITRKPGVEGIGELTVKYFTKVNGELTPLEGSSLPTDVGTYYVGINVGDDINYNSVSGLTSNNWNFTITPAGKHTYRLGNGSRVYLVTK